MLEKIAICVFMLFIVLPSEAKSITYGDLKVSEIVSIYDGDTFKVNIFGLHPVIGRNVNIRVAGVDTPEIRGKCPKEKRLAIQAKNVTKGFLLSANTIHLKNIRRGKYFRIVADVYGDDISLKKVLIESGLAVAYQGKSKIKKWCE
jgi:endonuclease YncB( thermonuclease family)